MLSAPGPEGVLRPGHGGPDAVDRAELGAGRRLHRLDAAARRGEALHRANPHQPSTLWGQEPSGPDKGTLPDVCKGICPTRQQTNDTVWYQVNQNTEINSVRLVHWTFTPTWGSTMRLMWSSRTASAWPIGSAALPLTSWTSPMDM